MIGVLALGLFLSEAVWAQSIEFSVLHSFGGADGAYPAFATLIQDQSGNFFGSTSEGGDLSKCVYGCGVIFKLQPQTGEETVLHVFSGGADAFPSEGGLIQDQLGDLYGTTSYDGGVIYSLNPAGTETVLHQFTHQRTGFDPYAGLVGDTEGNLYGTTAIGGNSGADAGLVFKLDKQGRYSVLHNFSGSDGFYPSSNLFRDSVGNLYGTTIEGGGLNDGVVFKVDVDGTETVLHSFMGSDGANPQSQLIGDESGNYGVAPNGGEHAKGVVFRINSEGTFSVLYNFTGGADGGMPEGKLFREPSTGNLYGTAYIGGSADCFIGCGAVFKIEPSGKETVLYAFAGLRDGFNPASGLIARATASGGLEFFGMANGGMSTGCPENFTGCGTVFRLRLDP